MKSEDFYLLFVLALLILMVFLAIDAWQLVF